MITRVLWNWLQLQRNQWLPKTEIEKLQLAKLRTIISHAYNNVPFYRRFYDKHRVRPDDLRSLDDIRKFPILGKELVRDVPLRERMAVGTDLSRCTLKTTSGSTGIPVTVLEDESSVSYLDAYHLRRLFEYGYRPWETIVRTTSEPLGKESLEGTSEARAGLMRILRRSRVKRLAVAGNIKEHVQLMSEIRPAFIAAPPSYLKVIFEVASAQGIKNIRPRVIMTWGEILDGNSRAFLGSSFGAKVYDGYGCTEVAPVGGLAWECRRRNGLHINSDTVVLEFLEDGEPVEYGESGEVVATSLFRFATPMIRYRLGDIATPLADTCLCGRGMPLIKNVEGRLVDFLRMPVGRLVSPYAVMFAVQDIPGIARFQVVQETLHKVVATIEKGEAFTSQTISQFKDTCIPLFGSDVELEISTVESFPTERGKKFRTVTSRLR